MTVFYPSCFDNICLMTVWHLVQDPTPQSSRLLYKFSTEADLAAWSVFTDQRFGGKSTAGLALSEERPVRDPLI